MTVALLRAAILAAIIALALPPDMAQSYAALAEKAQSVAELEAVLNTIRKETGE